MTQKTPIELAIEYMRGKKMHPMNHNRLPDYMIKENKLIDEIVAGLKAMQTKRAVDVDGLIAKLQGDCLDNICECIGATKEYNNGKVAMRDFIFRKLADYHKQGHLTPQPEAVVKIEKLEEALEIHNPECEVERLIHKAAKAYAKLMEK